METENIQEAKIVSKKRKSWKFIYAFGVGLIIPSFIIIFLIVPHFNKKLSEYNRAYRLDSIRISNLCNDTVVLHMDLRATKNEKNSWSNSYFNLSHNEDTLQDIEGSFYNLSWKQVPGLNTPSILNPFGIYDYFRRKSPSISNFYDYFSIFYRFVIL